MEKLSKVAPWIMIAFLLLVITMMRIDRDGLRAENVEFKAENVEWQEAAMPAIRARGWEDRYKVETLRSGVLTAALDPCRDREGWPIETNICDKARQNSSSYGSRSIFRSRSCLRRSERTMRRRADRQVRPLVFIYTIYRIFIFSLLFQLLAFL